MNLQPINASASPEVGMNENFETLEHQAVYGKRHPVTTGLTWGYCGGRWGGFSVAAATLALTGAATNYVVVEIATGAISVATTSTNWDDAANYLRVYKLTTDASAVTAIEDHRAGPLGVHGGSGAGGGGGSYDLAADIHVATDKATPVDADETALVDSAAANGLKKLTWANIKATLKTYCDTLYLALVAPGASGNVLTSNGTAWTSAAPSGGGSGGTKTYAIFTPMTSQPPASNYATLDTRNSIAVLDFDAGTEEAVFWVGIMPEGAALGSGLKVRIHWMATSATTNGVVWGAAFEAMTTDLDSDSFDTETTGAGTANGTSGIETVTEITCTTIDSIAAGGLFRLKIARKVADASDTMTGDAELIAVEVRSAV